MVFRTSGGFTDLPDSDTAQAENVEFTKNCGPLGRWFFSVDGNQIEFGGPQGVVYIDVFKHNT